MRAIKIGIITTLDTNIGDDFIRQGIINIINATYQDKKIKFVNVNKHLPYTAYPKWHPLRYMPGISQIKRGKILQKKFERIVAKLGGSKFDDCDLIIQSGAPVLWPECQNCEWNAPIWQEIVGRLHFKIPVFNIAAGACYPWETQPVKFPSPSEESYAKMISSFCRLVTTRDTLAKKLFDSIDTQNTLLTCTAFFVDKNFSNETLKEYILINYMSGAGHYDWGQQVDKKKWEETIKDTIIHLRKQHDVRFICHDEKEVELAKQLNLSLKIHFPKNVNEYLECISHAKLGINNRMHASVAMGSVGVPAISICTDTRLLMLDNIGLPIFYVKDVTSEGLIAESERLLESLVFEKNRLFNLKKKNFDQYCAIFKKHYN